MQLQILHTVGQRFEMVTISDEFWLETRLSAYCRSTILQKSLIIIIFICTHSTKTEINFANKFSDIRIVSMDFEIVNPGLSRVTFKKFLVVLYLKEHMNALNFPGFTLFKFTLMSIKVTSTTK